MKCQRERCSNLCHANTPFCEKHAPEWRRQRGTSYVPIEPVRVHVQRLRDAGLGWYRIARLSGTSAWVIRNIIHDGQSHVTLRNARNLLSVAIPRTGHELAAAGATVPSLGIQRRLRALVAIGYSNERLAKEIDYPKSQFHRLLGGEFNVTADVARKVEAAFNRLHMTPVPEGYASNRSRLRAVRRGWVVPMAWNLETIDNPAARPCGVGLSQHDWMSEYEKLRAKGYSRSRIAALWGIRPDSLNSRLQRAKAA